MTDLGIVHRSKSRQLCNTILDIAAEASLNLIMELRLAHNVEIHRLGLVIVLESADFQFVEFNEPGVELFKKPIDFACLPVEAENRPAGAIAIVSVDVLASVDDVFDDLLNRGKVSQHL